MKKEANYAKTINTLSFADADEGTPAPANGQPPSGVDSEESDKAGASDKEKYDKFGATLTGLAGGSEDERGSKLCDAEQIYFQLDFGKGTGYSGKEQVALFSINMPERKKTTTS